MRFLGNEAHSVNKSWADPRESKCRFDEDLERHSQDGRRMKREDSVNIWENTKHTAQMNTYSSQQAIQGRKIHDGGGQQLVRSMSQIEVKEGVDDGSTLHRNQTTFWSRYYLVESLVGKLEGNQTSSL